MENNEKSVKNGSVEDLKFDDKNFNLHSEFGLGAIEKSLRKNGAGRSILVDMDNNIIAGNGVTEAAINAGITKTKVVEVTGDELVVVKRTDLKLDSKQGREMALADNATAAADLNWDFETLKKVTEQYDLNVSDYGLEIKDDSEEENPYTMKVESPVYEAKGEQPEINELFDNTKTETLKADIKNANLPKDIEAFLFLAAERHTVFNFAKIAEYYCHAPKEVQELFEDSALVIIDFNKAIADGYVRLREEVRELMLNEVGKELEQYDEK